MPQTKEQILVQSPRAAQQLIEEGAAAERARIRSIDAQSMPIKALKFNGKSTAGDAAMAITAAAPQVRAAPAWLDEATVRATAEATWLSAPDVRAEFRGSKAAFIAYEVAAAQGRVRLWGGSK